MPRKDPATRTSEDPHLLANLYGAHSAWALQWPSSQIAPDPDMILIDSGTPIGPLNIAYVLRPAGALAAVERAAKFFGDRSRPWRLEAPVALRPRLNSAARSVGLTQVELRPAHAMARDELRPARPTPEFSVQKVDSAEKARVFRATIIEGMSGKPSQDVSPPARNLLPDMTLYVGYVAGEPVATAGLFAYRGVAGIYAVSTVERARRHGYGRAITERAALDGFEAGCFVSFLQSSVMGRSVYEGMGYRWIFDRAVWSPPV